MKKQAIAALACVAALALPEFAGAEEKPNTVGFQADVGVPDGAALSLACKPGDGPFTLTAGAAYNLMAVGPRLGLQLDVVGPLTLSADLGTSGKNDLSLFTDEELPSFYYNYANAQVGFATDGDFRFFMRGGISYVWFSVDDYQDDSVTLRYISGDALVVPTLKLGINWFVM